MPYTVTVSWFLNGKQVSVELRFTHEGPTGVYHYEGTLQGDEFNLSWTKGDEANVAISAAETG